MNKGGEFCSVFEFGSRTNNSLLEATWRLHEVKEVATVHQLPIVGGPYLARYSEIFKKPNFQSVK